MFPELCQLFVFLDNARQTAIDSPIENMDSESPIGDRTNSVPSRRHGRVAFLTLDATASLLTGLAAAPPTPALPASAKVFLDRNCVGCHRSAEAPAGLDLTAISFRLDLADTYGRWVRIHDAVKQDCVHLPAVDGGRPATRRRLQPR
jgi:hypothetical protein